MRVHLQLPNDAISTVTIMIAMATSVVLVVIVALVAAQTVEFENWIERLNGVAEIHLGP